MVKNLVEKKKIAPKPVWDMLLVETSRRLTTCTEKMVLASWLGRCFGNSKDGLFMVSGFSRGSCTCRWWNEPIHKLCPKLNPKSRSILRGIEIDQCKLTRFCGGDRKISSSVFQWFYLNIGTQKHYPVKIIFDAIHTPSVVVRFMTVIFNLKNPHQG